jgi:ATP-independent RNA helicase DbpA
MLQLIQKYQPESALIFCNQKAFVSELAESLAQEGVSCASIHGDLEQRDRDRVMAMFRNGSTRLLIATDVAARGLDIQGLHMVFNFDLPHQPEVYVHRIGRTGRAGKSGLAVSLATDREMQRLLEIERYTGAKLERKSLAQEKRQGSPRPTALRDAEMQTLSISAGRKDKIRPGDILGALTGEAGGFDASEIGKIEIHDTFTYVAVSAKIATTAFERLKNGRIKGRKFQVKVV